MNQLNSSQPPVPSGSDMRRFYPGADWAKFIAKAPLVTWRLGLGPLVGRWMMVLTTTGRKSGLPRRTMIECHWLNGRKYAPSGFGARSQWYQNIMANPYVTVQTTDGTEAMQAIRVTDDAELLAIFEMLQCEDPPFILNAYLKSIDLERADPAEIIANKERIYWLRFEPTDAATPPGLEVDLAWLWPVALFGLLGLGRLRALTRR